MSTTLLQKGKIVIKPEYNQYDIQQINDSRTIDYVIDFIKKRLTVVSSNFQGIKVNSPGEKFIILKSGTGSGKSTTLGPELYKKFFELTGKFIAITQPRVLTTIEIPNNIVRYYPELKMGNNIGYQTGNFAFKPEKGIIFMTIGTLSQQFKTLTDDEIIDKYSFIILDECHMREVETDITMSLIKSFIYRNYKRSDCPCIILTSATFDTEFYADFFGIKRQDILEVAGINYPIKQIFLETSLENYDNRIIETFLEIHKNEDDFKTKYRDILVFVYGNTPTKKIIKELIKINKKLKKKLKIVSLSSELFSSKDEQYQDIYKPMSSLRVEIEGKLYTPERRVIVSTPVAETGLTIGTLRYVIDTGYENNNIFNPIYNFSGLIVMPSSQASTIQRRGRVGRVYEGTWYPMFTEETYNKMVVDKLPDITTSNITELILSLIIKNKNINWDGKITTPYVPTNEYKLTELDLLTQPGFDTLTSALEKLFVLGFIDKKQNPTLMGLMANKITKSKLECLRMIFAGYIHGANIIDLITIAAFVTNGNNYINIKSKKKFTFSCPKKKDLKRFLMDDFIETIFIWDSFTEVIKKSTKNYNTTIVKEWCEENGFKYKNLLNISSIRLELINSFYSVLGLDPYYNGLNIRNYSLIKIFNNFLTGMEEVLKIKKCIYEGFRMNCAKWDTNKKCYMLNNNLPIIINSRATSYRGQMMQYIVVDKIELTNRQNKTKLYYLTASFVSSQLYYNIDNNFITS